MPGNILELKCVECSHGNTAAYYPGTTPSRPRIPSREEHHMNLDLYRVADQVHCLDLKTHCLLQRYVLIRTVHDHIVFVCAYVCM